MKIVTPMYNEETGEFLGLKKSLAFINVWEDEEKTYFNHGFSNDKSKVLYASQKMLILNVFSGTVLKRYQNEMLKGKRKKETFSKLFDFLPSNADRKEKINQHIFSVNLHVIDCPYDNFRKLSTPFLTSDVELGGEKRKAAHEFIANFLERSPETLNADLIRNTNYLRSVMDVELSVEKTKIDLAVPNKT